MADLEQKILHLIGGKGYKPMSLKALAKRLGVAGGDREVKRVARELVRQGRAQFDRDHQLRAAPPHGTVVGTFRRAASATATSAGTVRAAPGQTHPVSQDILIPDHASLDAATGDEVLVRVLKKSARADGLSAGEVLQILRRATRKFVGGYHVRDGQGYVRVSGTVFAHSIWVGDPGAKGAADGDEVVIEMLRFPAHDDHRGQAVIAEVLGPRGAPGVDVLSIIRGYELPDAFPAEASAEAARAAELFDPRDFTDRTDFTQSLVITIDPVDARDFDDAVSLRRDAKSGNWILTVHIADVAHFVPPGGYLDGEARQRGTSVYLPGRVLPMLPELISNGLASLQQDQVRYVKTAVMEFTPEGAPAGAEFHNGVIRNRRRFAYEEVSDFLARPHEWGPERLDSGIAAMLTQMRDFALTLRDRRLRRGALELSMPEPVLEYDAAGAVSGAHFAVHDISHQIIEEFMLAANCAVAWHFKARNVATLRRIHPAPEGSSLETFAEFVRQLGYRVRGAQDRFELQRVLAQASERGEAAAVHFALLKSLKQAVYSPSEDEHYALAFDHYLHFTSPIRRYPDLVVHRMLGQWIETKKVGSDREELAALGDHCSRLERRAEKAERELVKLKLLTYLSTRIGTRLAATITGVSDYGFFALGDELPAEGLVHISALGDDYYHYDDRAHSLEGARGGRRYRLGDKVTVEVVRVDLNRRMLDFRVVGR